MEKITCEMCPETGICSLVRNSTDKVDLMNFEVDQLRTSRDDLVQAREIISQANKTFANNLTDDELKQLLIQIA